MESRTAGASGSPSSATSDETGAKRNGSGKAKKRAGSPKPGRNGKRVKEKNGTSTTVGGRKTGAQGNDSRKAKKRAGSPKPGRNGKKAKQQQEKKKPIYEVYTSIQCALGTIAKQEFYHSDTGCKKIIDDAVRTNMQVLVEGSHLINAALLNCCRTESGEPLSFDAIQDRLPEIDQTFIRRILALFVNFNGKTLDGDAPELHENEYVSAAIDLYRKTVYGKNGQKAFKHKQKHVMPRLLTTSARKYIAECRNHVTLSIHGHLCAMLRRHVKKIVPYFGGGNNHKQLKAAISIMAVWILYAAKSDGTDKFTYAGGAHAKLMKALGDNQGVVQQLVGIVDNQRHTHRSVLPVHHYFGQGKWPKLLAWHCELKVEADDAAKVFDEQAIGRRVRGRRVRGRPKQFKILPTSTYEAQYILVDDELLYGLLRAVDDRKAITGQPKLLEAAGYPDIGTNKAFLKSKTAGWKVAFDVSNLHRSSKQKGLDERFTIRTDGVGATVSFYRVKPDCDKDKGAKAAAKGRPRHPCTPKEDYPSFEGVKPHCVAGVDPGRRTFVTVVRPSASDQGAEQRSASPENQAPSRKRPAYLDRQAPSRERELKNRGKKKKTDKKKEKRSGSRGGKRNRARHDKGDDILSVSNKQWQHESGNTWKRWRLSRWLKQDRGAKGKFDSSLFEMLRKTPISAKKARTMAEMLQRSKHVHSFLDRLLDHNVKRRVRRVRFQADIRRTAALDALCLRISAALGKNGIVAWGHAQCSRGFGYAPAPVLELRKRLAYYTNVVIVHENMTSQRCSKCASKEGHEGPYKTLVPGRQGSDADLFGVRHCTECQTDWDRDVNAARNMRMVAIEYVRTGKRPAAFAFRQSQA
eukprot:UC1_evm3s1639